MIETNNRTKELLSFFNEFYITERKKYLVQSNNADYFTIKQTLTDFVLKKHIMQKSTIGIYAGNQITKFICFDIDMESKSLDETLRIHKHLTKHYFKEENVLVSFSGSKGFHLELFFDEVVPLEYAKLFYERIVRELDLIKNKVEFRPTANQGVKLPLSIHRKTKMKSFILEHQELFINPSNFLSKLKKIERQSFFDVIQIEKEYLAEQNKLNMLEIIKKGSKNNFDVLIKGNVHSIKSEVLNVLKKGHLLESGSRDLMTFNISLFLKSNGFSKEKIFPIVKEIIETTFKYHSEFIKEDTTLEYAIDEISRILKLIYEKDYHLSVSENKKVEIYNYELIHLLNMRKEHQKLGLSALFHFKRFNQTLDDNENNSFYMTYEQLNNYGNTENRSRLFKMIDELKNNHFFESIERGRIDSNSSTFRYLPNFYSIAKIEKIKGIRTKKINLTEKILKNKDVDEILVELFPKDILKKEISSDVFKKRFSKLYT
jgi:hypothetical protein